MQQQMIDLEAFYRGHAVPSPRYSGQLAPEFQAALTARFRNVVERDCEFYHTMMLADGHVVTGKWDLRGHEKAYTGSYSFDSKRLIEFGPASGHFSAYFDRCGAEVTVFDLPFDRGPELVPYDGLDSRAMQQSGANSVARLRNSWWYTKRAIGFRANAVYGDIYVLPDDLGQFDVAFFGSVLPHLSNPFLALRSAAAITTEAIIVTDLLGVASQLPLAEETQRKLPLMLFNPSAPPGGLVHWWSLSPGAIGHMLEVLGFTEMQVTRHTPAAMQPPRQLFTVVARRPAAKLPRR